MVHVSSTMWQIKDQPSNSTSWSDYTLQLLVLVAAYYIENFKWHLHFQFGIAFWRIVLREVYFEEQNRIQSWTVGGSSKFSPSVDWNHVSKVREHLQDENTKTVLCSCRHFQVGGVIFNARVACQRLWLYLKAEKRTTYFILFFFFFSPRLGAGDIGLQVRILTFCLSCLLVGL